MICAHVLLLFGGSRVEKMKAQLGKQHTHLFSPQTCFLSPSFKQQASKHTFPPFPHTPGFPPKKRKRKRNARSRKSHYRPAPLSFPFFLRGNGRKIAARHEKRTDERYFSAEATLTSKSEERKRRKFSFWALRETAFFRSVRFFSSLLLKEVISLCHREEEEVGLVTPLPSSSSSSSLGV